MRFGSFAPLAALSLLFAALLPAAPAAAQIPASADNALTCAMIYAYVGDTGPAYERLVAKAAELSKRSVADVRADLAQRGTRLSAAVADGRLNASDFDNLVAQACPEAFGVAPARPGASASVAASRSGQPDPVRCAGLFRWFDSTWQPNAWGSTWAGDEMVRRAAAASGVTYETMERQASGFSRGGQSVPALLDEAVACQQAYDTPVPPGAVIAATESGDRPGIDRGRVHYCKALGKSFDNEFPDISSYEDAIARHPPSGMNQALEKMKSLQWYLNAMEKALCPAEIGQPRVDAFKAFAERSTAATNAAKSRLQREGRWWR